MSTVFNKGDKVRYSANGEIGEITGKYQERLNRWQVLFNGVDAKYIPAEKLELIPKLKDVRELFIGGDFKTITDFRRRIYRYRMSGKLTNLMYSMDNAKTQFLPHQFIPVVRFLESYTDRLLIADEVGLGKTIEAMYIWEELVARKNAKRLLVVAPAVLREKWKGDIRRFFDIDAEIVSAQNANSGRTLLSSIHDARGNPTRTAFVLIVSLEGLRSAEKVRETLEQCRDVEKVFDMTIIDEAHYMRNSPTESFKTGELLRDVSSHLVLLSATPIQTSSTNFFTLLNLLSPEDFEYKETFDEQLCENRPLVKIANSLECGDDEETIRLNIEAALRNPVFSTDSEIRSLSDNLSSFLADVDKRVKMIDCIKSKYFYSGFVTRSRKRDVFPNRVTRNVASVNFHLNDYERQFYDEVTRYLQEQDRQGGQNNISTFRLITRQHQMSSSIPAALRAWRGYGVDDDFDEELSSERTVDSARMVTMPAFDGFDLEKLERYDSKFDKVLAKIKNILEDNPSEKIIIFSFFRNTVRYLYERLSAANVSATYIMGGIDMHEKQRRLAEFEDCDINVLVSSEVGSEGIDLQFARYELNYDLPWNPMRLEQRIGRIDRIGQKSSDIYICNAYCENTISDRILRRLYERIEEFRNVIGDLEEVMGEQVRNLEVDVFREHRELTDDDVKERAEQCVNAICHQQQITKSLELQAGNMASPHQEFILRNINKSYEAKRLITPEELMFFCRDILQEMYQGSSVTCVGVSNIADVRLSDAARREFTRFLTNASMAYGTQLNSCSKGLRCGFGRKYSPSQCDDHVVEVVDVNHPLVRWLLSVVERNTIYTSGCEVVEIKRSKLPCDVKIEAGCYAYLIQHWESDGVRNINELRYCICRGVHNEVQEPIIIDGYDAERIMMSVVVDGAAYDVTILQDGDFNACGIAMEHVDKHMEDDFCNFEEQQKVRNSNLIEEQSRYIKRTAAVKSCRLRAAVDKMRMELSQGLIQGAAAGRHEGLIKANEKRIENIIAKRDERIARIEDKLDCNPTFEDVALGILFVTEG